MTTINQVMDLEIIYCQGEMSVDEISQNSLFQQQPTPLFNKNGVYSKHNSIEKMFIEQSVENEEVMQGRISQIYSENGNSAESSLLDIKESLQDMHRNEAQLKTDPVNEQMDKAGSQSESDQLDLRNKMDPYWIFFQLVRTEQFEYISEQIQQSVKLNSKQFQKISQVDCTSLYREVVQGKIPFNEWYRFVRRALEKRQ